MNKLAIGAAALAVVVLVIIIFTMKPGGGSNGVGGSEPIPMAVTIGPHNNEFSYYHRNQRQHTVTIPSGTYTPEDLASVLKIYLSTEESGWDVAWSAVLGKFTFQQPNFHWSRCDRNNSIYPVVGLTAGADCGITWRNSEISDVRIA